MQIEVIHPDGGQITSSFETDKESLREEFLQYQSISIQFSSDKILQPQLVRNGLGGITLVETEVTPFEKNYDILDNPSDIIDSFNLDNWLMVRVEDGDKMIAGAIIAQKTEGVNMLRDRSDLAVIWDIRVNLKERGQGFGRLLFDYIVQFSKSKDCKEIHIETQTNNIAACKFYHKLGGKVIQTRYTSL